MKKKMSVIYNLISVCLLIFMLITACGQKSQQSPQPQQQQMQTQDQSDKVPDQLKSIELSIEKIIKDLNGPAIVPEEGQGKDKQDKDSKGQPEEKGSEDKSKDKQGGESDKKDQGSQDQKDSGQEKKSAQNEKPPAQSQDPWQKITPVINSLHYQWNAYMPMALKQGANRQLLENFSTSLNNLTNYILAKNSVNTLLASSSLYAWIPDFYSLYKTESSPEIKRIRHFTRNSVLNSMTANWAQAEADIASLKSSWAVYKGTVPKDQQENASKLDFSIFELEKVIKEKNQALSDMKGRVALSNIQSLDKTSGQEGQAGGQQ